MAFGMVRAARQARAARTAALTRFHLQTAAKAARVAKFAAGRAKVHLAKAAARGRLG
jgi:hypothetical protein